jgi:hypothetical protein
VHNSLSTWVIRPYAAAVPSNRVVFLLPELRDTTANVYWPTLGCLRRAKSLPSRQLSTPAKALIPAKALLIIDKELVRLLEGTAFQLTCKFLYLVFPRHIDDSFGIVEQAVAQKI